jgi:hypothetical protein
MCLTACLAMLLAPLSSTVAQTACTAPDSWFPQSQTKPFDPAKFPGSSATNCDFHQWAWQTFLYLTQKVDGKLRFTTFPTDRDLFNPKNLTAKPKILAALMARKPSRMQLRVRSLKDEKSSLNDADKIAQAGGGGVLVDQNGNPVFYSVNFDPVFYDFVQKNGYYDYDTYIKADPTTNFPLGAMELKASWRIVNKGDDTTGVYTTEADVPVLQQDDKGNVSVVPGKTRTVTVAFVGIHIVGIVANHPEFIWATFEQHQNAPELSAVPSSNAFTFYAPNTAANDCLINAVKKNELKLDAAKQTFTPITQVYRLHPNGDKPGTPNSANITSLNNSVHGKLEAGSVWKNYDLVGGIWLFYDGMKPTINPTIQPNGFNTDSLRGSLLLANTTMETFHQNLHCFVCHTTAGSTNPFVPAMNMNFSHILVDGLLHQNQAKQAAVKAAAKKAAAKASK